MNLFRHFRDEVIRQIETLTSEDRLPADLDVSRVSIDLPKDPDHGDIATNAAMVLAKPAGMKPRDIAEMLAEGLRARDGIDAVEIAGPGFINMRLTTDFWQDRLSDILKDGRGYGDSDLGAGRKVNVEYVSANPTGPMHVGHGRGAVFGDALAAVLEKAGFDVTREYYINDAGAQVDVLARSLYHRYMEALGEDMGEVAEGLYPGDYLVPAGAALAKRDGTRWKNAEEATWLEPVRTFAIDAMMEMIREDLGAIGIHHDTFSSERALVNAGGVDRAFDFLSGKGLIYEGVLEPPKGKTPDDWEPREQTLFRASDFGDDTDRPLKKSDGSWTYFGTDIAYHYDKFTRGFNDMIDVWGADHGGYVKRMQAAVKAMTDGQGDLDVKLCQMVNLLENGEPVKMSKRAGTFVTLRDVIDRVGKDVVRFIMLTRKNDAQLDFDFARVTEQSKDNPVFYVQYAHARAYSVRRMALDVLSESDISPAALRSAPLERLTDPAELDLIRELAAWPRLVESAALAHEPHRVAFYLGEVAAKFHGLWNKGKDDTSLRFVVADDLDLTRARLALVQGMANVIASGLAVMGVEAVEELR